MILGSDSNIFIRILNNPDPQKSKTAKHHDVELDNPQGQPII